MRELELRVRQKEIHRMHVVRLTIEGRETVGRGAKLLGISPRQMKRLRRKIKERGVKGLLHGNRGKAAWNKTVSEKIEQVLVLARGRYQGLNDTHLTEKLKEKDKIALSRPTVRTILRQAGIAAVRKRGVKRHYRRRERKAQEGALLLWDGSPHRWFGEHQDPCNLTAVIDDATGALLHGFFTLEEDAQSYLICLREILLDKGIPLALYMDRHGIFRRNDDHWSLHEQLAGEQTPTQVGQALRHLGIQPIFALSPQAKGRVERLFNTLQDRLVQELRLAGLSTPQQGSSFVNGPFKPISTPGLQSRLGKAKPHGGRCPRELMSIGSAAFAIKPLSAMIMRFASQESFSISRQVRGIGAIAKLASRCATSSTDAGVSTPKTGCSWRPRRPSSKRR